MAKSKQNLNLIFKPGPLGFLDDSDGPSRLRQFICAMNPSLSCEASSNAGAAAEVRSEMTDGAAAKKESTTDAETWKTDAVRKCKGLWTGDTNSIRPVIGVDPPRHLLAFEAAVRGADPWRSFEELQLNAAVPREPSGAENLFEKCVLSDQLDYLGTALPELFAGLVNVGTLGNGDKYHLDLFPEPGKANSIYLFDHETHCIERAFSISIEVLAFFSALCRAADEGLVSKTVVSAGFKSLQGKVAPSWHFNMEERRKKFKNWEQEPGESYCIYMSARASWIFALLRQDRTADIEDIRRAFNPDLNGVLPPKNLRQRIEIAHRSAPTALYATWRAYLFDEPELPQYLDACREHPARIARDAAQLIQSLRNGRKSLGCIADWPNLLAQFRSLNLDPRFTAKREAEIQTASSLLEKERAAVREALALLEGEEELAFVAEHLKRAELHGAMLHTLLSKEKRAEAKRAMVYLLDEAYSRGNLLFRYEELDACRHVAEHADPPLLLLMLGRIIHQSEADENDPVPTPGQASRIVLNTPDKLPKVGRQELQNALAELDVQAELGWRERMLVTMAGKLGDPEFTPVLQNIAARLPSEGDFDTALAYDDFIGAVAVSLREIGSTDTAVLVPFAVSMSPRMRNARIESALAIAVIMPNAFTDEMAERALTFVEEINDPAENAKALLTVAKGKPGIFASRNIQPKAGSVEVRCALALLKGDMAAAARALDSVFTQHSFDRDWTLKKRRFGLLVHALFGICPEAHILRAAAGIDLDFDAELMKIGEFEAPRYITWFEVEHMDVESLKKVLSDPTVRGRAQAARYARHKADCRQALEIAVHSVLDQTIDDDAKDVLREGVMSLVALPEADSTVALFDLLLKHESKDAKDPVLRHLPAWSGLRSGMEYVRSEKWGWQENAAAQWLKKFG